MRYAVYHLPQGELGDWGSAWLGWDARESHADSASAGDHGAEIRAAADLGRPATGGATGSGARNGAALPRPQSVLTATPRRYGFHATMKTPMHLAEGQSIDALREALRELAGGHKVFGMEMALNWDWGFLALRPTAQPAALMALGMQGMFELLERWIVPRGLRLRTRA